MAREGSWTKLELNSKNSQTEMMKGRFKRVREWLMKNERFFGSSGDQIIIALDTDLEEAFRAAIPEEAMGSFSYAVSMWPVVHQPELDRVAQELTLATSSSQQ